MKARDAPEPREPTRSERRVGVLLVIAAASLWSLGGVGVKVAVAEPLVIAGARSFFACLFMSAVLAVGLKRSGAGTAELLALLRRPLVWAGAVSYAVMVGCFVLAARRTTSANAIFIQYTAPVYVVLLGGRLLGERASARDLLAVAACVAGMILTFWGEIGGGRTMGNVLAVASSFGFAGLPLALRLDQRRLLGSLGGVAEAAGSGQPPPSGRATARVAAHAPVLAMSLGNALLAVVALPAFLLHPIVGDRAAATWVLLGGLGAFQMGLPYVLYATAVRRLRALESTLLASIEPVLNPLWVVLATGERPSALALAGGAIIVAAVAAQSIARPASAS